MKIVKHSYSRLCFKADIIESLEKNNSFIVHTPSGTFQLTKAEFYSTFPNVLKTRSYKEERLYRYKYPSKRILLFLVSSSTATNSKLSGHKVSIDLVGDKIRERNPKNRSIVA